VARPGLTGTPKLAAQARLGFYGGLGGGFIAVPVLGRVLSVGPGVGQQRRRDGGPGRDGAVGMGLLLGAGATLAPRNRLTLLVEVAYELGLVSIVAASDPADIKNRSLGVRAGLLFSL
jgi:hypothetical protein